MVAEIIRKYSSNVSFSRHSIEEMEKDDLTLGDVWNVLKSGDSRIVDPGELERGSYRYRLETKYIMVVIAFHENGCGMNIITVWDKRIKRGV